VVGELVVGEGQGKPSTVGQGAGTTPLINQIVAKKPEVLRAGWRHWLILRVAKDAQEIATLGAPAPTKKVVEVEEVVEHEVLVDDVWPIVVQDLIGDMLA